MRYLKRLIKAAKILARENRLPRWLKGLAAFGVAPIPGPVDEVVLFVVAGILAIFYRPLLKEAWHSAKL